MTKDQRRALLRQRYAALNPLSGIKNQRRSRAKENRRRPRNRPFRMFMISPVLPTTGDCPKWVFAPNPQPEDRLVVGLPDGFEIASKICEKWFEEFGQKPPSAVDSRNQLPASPPEKKVSHAAKAKDVRGR